MVSNSTQLDRRTKQHTEFGVSVSNGSRDMGRAISWRKKRKKKNVRGIPYSIPYWGSLLTNAD